MDKTPLRNHTIHKLPSSFYTEKDFPNHQTGYLSLHVLNNST